MGVSLICCYNNEEQFIELSKSLKTQSFNYELIGINNTGNKFSSCASALNSGARKATQDFLIFLHQDIRFTKDTALEEFIKETQKITETKYIIGLYGAGEKDNPNIYNDIYEVETVDECFFGMPRSVWSEYMFNEILCDSWHLYAVEICIRLSEKNGSIYQINSSGIIHLSTGNVDKSYMKTFRKLLLTYNNHKHIYTTCKSFPNNIYLFDLYYFIWRIKKAVFGNYGLVHKLKSIKHDIQIIEVKKR